MERAEERDTYRIERLPSREDMERARLKNLQPPRPLQTETVNGAYLHAINPDITLRGYQIRAMEAIARGYDELKKRQFLLEMATGTGKTLLCAALIRRFLRTHNAERVLFIVDRIELAKQTMEDFLAVLGEFNPVIYKTARRTGELVGSSVVVATIQSLMMDRRYREEFTPFYFEGADFDTECQAKCVSLNHVCIDEKTGEFVEPLTVGCQRQLDQLLEACQVP